MHAEEQLPAVEVAMTILHAGGKFGKGGYRFSGGAARRRRSRSSTRSHRRYTRCAATATNMKSSSSAASRRARSKRIGRAEGHRHVSVVQTGTPRSSRRSTSLGAFSRSGCANSRFLNRRLRITLRDERVEDGENPKEKTYFYEGGIVSFRRVAEREQGSA